MEEQEIKQRIETEAGTLFMRYGIRSVSMDDIAKQVSMSKKTLYTHFKDKDGLIMQVMKAKFEEDRVRMDRIQVEASNAVEEFVLFSKMFREEMKDLNPAVVYDLKKYYPKVWDQFSEHKEYCYEGQLIATLQRGKKEGFILVKINEHILVKMRMHQVESAFDPDLFPPSHFNTLEVQLELLNHFFRGVCTAKGMEKLKEYQDSL